MAQDTGGVKDAGKWITDAKATYTVLIDQEHLVSKLYHMVNVPTGVWINEQGRIVRPNEVRSLMTASANSPTSIRLPTSTL